RTSRTRARARSRKRRAPSKTPNGASPGHRSATRSLKRKRVLREETDAVQAQTGNREQRDRDQEPDRSARREEEGDQHDQRQVRRRQAAVCRADQRESTRPEEVGFLRLSGQLPLQNLVHLRGIRLALGRLHHLTDEGVERLILPGAIVFGLLGVRGEDLVHYFLDLACIADLL